MYSAFVQPSELGEESKGVITRSTSLRQFAADYISKAFFSLVFAHMNGVRHTFSAHCARVLDVLGSAGVSSNTVPCAARPRVQLSQTAPKFRPFAVIESADASTSICPRSKSRNASPVRVVHLGRYQGPRL
jgi:hypothetical protein